MDSPNSRFQNLSGDQIEDLHAMFSKGEIRKAVWSCGSDRAPGLDEFTFQFLKQFWDFFKQEFGIFL